MRIIIVGAGISGLSTYLFLQKHLQSIQGQHFDIKIYEGYDVSKYVKRIVTPEPESTLTAGAPQSDTERAAHALNDEHTFTPEAIGSAIGIARNGLNVLSRLTFSDKDELGVSAVLADVIREGYPVTNWRMSSARGWLLADVNMAPKQASHKAASIVSEETNQTSSWESSPINLVMISRQAFWSILLRHTVKNFGEKVIQHKKVVDMVIPEADSPKQTIVRFADGSAEHADLVIGADGLRSVVRKAIFSSSQTRPSVASDKCNNEEGLVKWLLSFFSSSVSKPKDCITPHYSGLVGVGSFIPSSLLTSTSPKHPENTMSIVFGPNGFFGYGIITSSPTNVKDNDTSPTTAGVDGKAQQGGTAVWWSTFASPDPYPYTLSESTGRHSNPLDFDKPAALKALLLRHRSWKDSGVRAIVTYLSQSLNPTSAAEAAKPTSTSTSTHTCSSSRLTSTSTSEDLGRLGFYTTYTTPLIPTYSLLGRIVLTGDAAHALQPSSGQGACMALEDAEILALLLKQYLTATPCTGAVAGGEGGESTQDQKQEQAQGRAQPQGQNQATEESEAVLPSSSSPSLHTQRKAVATALRKFDHLRLPRLRSIYVMSERMSGMKSDMNVIAEMGMYLAIWLMTRVGRLTGGGPEEVGGYDLPGEVERAVGLN